MISVYNYTIEEYIKFFEEMGEKKFRAKQMFNAIYKNRVHDFEEITTIKKDLREKLKTLLYFDELEVIDIVESDTTVKFLFKLESEHIIETVLMRQVYGNSVCVTTQVGCSMGCGFCASGQLKKVRNLNINEIVLQILMVEKYVKERISHVVVMGIGEPFDNFDNVMDFISIINSDLGLEIGARHITISTCGVVPKIKEFTDLNLQVNLAISLHASNDEVRNKLMPINKRYNMKELKEALFYYCDNSNRRLTIEYLLIDGVNDSVDHAKELVKYLRGLHYYINLIPLNSVDEKLFKRSKPENIANFKKYLDSIGVNARIRQEFGSSIDAACGQLRVKHIEGESL